MSKSKTNTTEGQYISSIYYDTDIYDMFDRIKNQNIDDIIAEFNSFKLNDKPGSKIALVFEQILVNIEQTLDNYKYIINLYLDANKGKIIQVSFKTFYNIYLSPKNFYKHKIIRKYLNSRIKIVTETNTAVDFKIDITNIDFSGITSDTITDIKSYYQIYNQLIETLSDLLVQKFITGYLQQYTHSILDYYNTIFKITYNTEIKKSQTPSVQLNFYKFKPSSTIETSYYKTVPWIDGNVIQIYIALPNLVEDNNSSIIQFETFIINSIPGQVLTTESNILWFKPNKYFYNLLANKRIIRTQQERVLTFFNSMSEEILKVMIAYKVFLTSSPQTEMYYFQDEQLFSREKQFMEYLETSRELSEYNVNYYLDTVIDSKQ